MEKVYGNVRPLPKEKGTRRRRRSDRRNRAQAQAVVTTMPAGDEAASQYDAVLAEAAAASVGESVSAYAEDVIIDVEILPDTGDVAVPGVFAFKAAPAAESVSAAPVSVALPAAPRVGYSCCFSAGCILFSPYVSNSATAGRYFTDISGWVKTVKLFIYPNSAA